jgi:hyperosmotically inducible protein
MKRFLLLFSIAVLVAAWAPAPAQSASQEGKQAKANEGSAVKDSWLTTKTKTKLFADGRVKGRAINVETQAGVVTLRGKVESDKEKSAAEAIAKKVDGVKSVHNVLQVVPDSQRKAVDAKDDDIKDAVKARLAKDDRLKDASVKVRSDNGLVTLMGSVANAQTKSRAADLARGVAGVKAVRNELK